MGLLSAELEEKRLRLSLLARRLAFDSNMRHGVVPARLGRMAAAAADEAKFLDFCSSLSSKSLGGSRPTTHYLWRTVGDDRVRGAHAAHAGQVFSWSSGPGTGHPGAEPNCRCWAEHYYGNPAIPDALLQMQRTRRIDTSGGQLWTSIETLTRPDESLAESIVLARDGTRIHSHFVGTSVSHVVTLPDGKVLRVETRDGIQRIFEGNSPSPALEVAWTPDGPQIVGRIREAQLRTLQILPPLFPPTGTRPPRVGLPKPAPFDQIPVAQPTAVLAHGLVALFNAISADPPSFGAGTADVPVIAFRAWTGDGTRGVSAVSVATLTAEQISQWCKRLPEVQTLTNVAAQTLAPLRPTMGAAVWGTAVHKQVQTAVETLKRSFPVAYQNIFAELSISDDASLPSEDVSYGQARTTRLDILERVSPDLVCVYDIKTGKAGLSMARVRKIAERVGGQFPRASFYIIEVRPFE